MPRRASKSPQSQVPQPPAKRPTYSSGKASGSEGLAAATSPPLEVEARPHLQAKLDKDRQDAPLQPFESPSSLSDPAVIRTAKKEPVGLHDRQDVAAAPMTIEYRICRGCYDRALPIITKEWGDTICGHCLKGDFLAGPTNNEDEADFHNKNLPHIAELDQFADTYESEPSETLSDWGEDD